MTILPFRRFDIRSPLPPTVASDLLATLVEPRGTLRRCGADWPFHGWVEVPRFVLKRIDRTHGSVLPGLRTLPPVIRGRIEAEHGGGCRVVGVIRPALGEVVLLIAITAAAFLGSIWFVLRSATIEQAARGALGLSLVWLWLLIFVNVGYPIRTELDDLTELVTAPDPNDDTPKPKPDPGVLSAPGKLWDRELDA